MADGHWIDGLSRALARGTARRDVLRLLAIGAGGLLLGRPPAAAAEDASRARPACGPPVDDCAKCTCPRGSTCVPTFTATSCVAHCTERNPTWGLPACGIGHDCACPPGTTCTFYGCCPDGRVCGSSGDYLSLVCCSKEEECAGQTCTCRRDTCCRAGEKRCGKAGCRRLDNDPQNCGRCGKACKPGYICKDGKCVCDPANAATCPGGCCPHPNGVCCAERPTCCPQGQTCVKAGKACCPPGFTVPCPGDSCCPAGHVCCRGGGCCPAGSRCVAAGCRRRVPAARSEAEGEIIPHRPEAPAAPSTGA
jgi:hypothetical protein